MKYPLLIKLYIVILRIIQTWRLLDSAHVTTAESWLAELSSLPTWIPVPRSKFEKRFVQHIYTWMDDERWRVSPVSSCDEYQLYTR